MEFEAIAREYSGMLYRHIHRMVGNREDAQDVLQDVLLLIFRKLDTFKGDASLKTWLFRVASNRTIDFLRRRNRRPETELTDNHVCHSNPFDHAVRTDRRDQLARLLAALPDEQRLVVVLKEIDGFTFREIGAMLGIPENTAKTRLYTALRKMKTQLTDSQPETAGPLFEPGRTHELPDTP